MVDCNGVANHVAGSVIRSLVYTEARLGTRIQDRLDHINGELLAFYNARPRYNRMPPIRLTNLTGDAGWAVLNGQTVKAANCRALIPFLVELADRYFDGPPSTKGALARRAIRALQKYYEIVYTAGMFVNAEQLKQLRRTRLIFGVSYQQLRMMCQSASTLEWNVVPKVHYFMHMDSVAEHINPTHVQNYHEETRVGLTTRIWARSARGVYRNHIQELVCLKGLVGFFLRWETGL